MEAPDWFDDAQDLFESGDVDGAFALLEDRAPEDHGLRWIATSGFWQELGELDRALRDLERAATLLGSEDAEVLHARARLAIEIWDFDAAERWLDEVHPGDRTALTLYDRSFIADARGDTARALELLNAAHGLAPEAVAKPLRLTEDEFEHVVRAAVERLPEDLQGSFGPMAVVVDAMPTRELVGPDLPPDILGLFTGPPLAEHGTAEGGELPPTIFLFQRNLERMCTDLDELEEEIAITLYHELGHALGFDEEGVDELGLG